MKLTLNYIKKAIKNDKRFDGIDDNHDGSVSVWTDPAFTWNALDGNRTVGIFWLTNDEHHDTVEFFKQEVAGITPAMA